MHENGVNAMVTCSYKWPTYNVCVNLMKLSCSSQDFKLTMPIVQEFWPPQEGLHKQAKEKLGQNNLELLREIQLQFINVDVTDKVLSI